MKKEMSRQKRVILSLVGGVLLAALLTLAGFGAMYLGKIELSRAILWNATLLIWLVGPGPLLGYDAQGNPLYEGTPVDMVAGYLGLALGVPVYSALCYLVFCIAERRKKAKGGLTSACS